MKENPNGHIDSLTQAKSLILSFPRKLFHSSILSMDLFLGGFLRGTLGVAYKGNGTSSEFPEMIGMSKSSYRLVLF